MDGIKVKIPVYIPVQDVIDAAQPRRHFSCDWLQDPLALGIYLFPLAIYRKMEELKQCPAKAS